MRAFGCAVAIVLTAAAPASADILKLYGEVHGGGMGGKGIAGDQQDEAFFANAPHPMYGLEVAARLLIVEAHIRHHQYRGDGQLATWTQFSVGTGVSIDLGDEQQQKDHTSMYAEFNSTVGFGLGTGRQVDPPLSNDEITDKGFIGEGRFGIGKHLNKYLDLGVAVAASYGYFFKNGVNDSANDVSSQYRSFQVEGLGYLRVSLKLL
jgi:hypothetical protein